jgi:alkanesulfonate monooxygenase SsuD/methylene tetrahydromethanopterin reductase-like flavin-dependent oxidoreductase (luciferase family)
VNVGIYLDLRNPPGWPHDPARLHAFTLELCEEAEHLGAHSIWVTEHHQFDDGYLTQPLTFAAAIAARTRRVRVGTAVVLAPLHRSVEIAEQAALVDLVAGGRLELGLGAGYRLPEFELFGADPATRYGATDTTARELRELWTRLTPAPVQARIPIWMGYGGPQGARRAGRLGEGLLSVDPALVEPYRAGLAEAGHDPATARMAGSVQGWISDDPEADWPTVSRHVVYQMDSYRRHMVEGTGRSVPRPVDPERLRQSDDSRPLASFLLATPEAAAAALSALRATAPVETVFFFASIGGMDEEWTLRHVQTLCTRLAPLVRDLDTGND